MQVYSNCTIHTTSCFFLYMCIHNINWKYVKVLLLYVMVISSPWWRSHVKCEMEKGWENLYISNFCVCIRHMRWGQNIVCVSVQKISLIFFHVLFSYSTKRSLECTNILFTTIPLYICMYKRSCVLSFFAYGHCFLGNNNICMLSVVRCCCCCYIHIYIRSCFT